MSPISLRIQKANVTAGLKWAPETGPKTIISTTKIAPVGTVFPNKAIAVFPPASLSAMIPEPTTVARRNVVPINSANSFL